MQANRQKSSSESFSLSRASLSTNEALRCSLRVSAQADVRGSYDWGCRVWGRKEAQRWVRELRATVSKQLSLIPKAFPVAPEHDEFPEEIRQMIVGRYRVLFTIRKHKVHVLHVRGALSHG